VLLQCDVPDYSVRLLENAMIFFVRVSVTESREFLVVCGALVLLTTSVVEVLHFQRFD